MKKLLAIAFLAFALVGMSILRTEEARYIHRRYMMNPAGFAVNLTATARAALRTPWVAPNVVGPELDYLNSFVTPVPWPQVGRPQFKYVWKSLDGIWTKPTPVPTPIPGPMDLRPGQLRWFIPL